MKNLTILSILIIALLAGSCSQLLDVEAEGTISGDVLSNEGNIQQALNGAYYNFAGYADGVDGGELIAGDFIIIPTLLARRSGNIFPQELLWQNVLAPTSYQDFVNKAILNTNGRVAANWRRAYETINIINNILANIDNVADGTTRERIRGEALAIRGIIYFEMVKLWAPHYRSGIDPEAEPALPIRTEPITDINGIPELTPADINSVEEVYRQAEQDLLEAAVALEPFDLNLPNLSYYACQAFLTRLYLQKGQYSDAVTAANEIIGSGRFQLNPTPADAFNNSSNTAEDIFAIQQTLANNAGDRTNGIGVTAFYSSLTESGLGVMRILNYFLGSQTFDLLNSPRFPPGDLRATVDVSTDASTSSEEINTAFYRSIVDNSPEVLSSAKYTSAQNVLPVVRLAEIYLSRAEAAFESLGGAINPISVSDLNTVRIRAGLPSLQASDFQDDFAFFDSLTVERNRELLHEGHLLHDLRRWRFFGGYNIGTSTSPIDPWSENLVLPIPQSELDAGDFD